MLFLPHLSLGPVLWDTFVLYKCACMTPKYL